MELRLGPGHAALVNYTFFGVELGQSLALPSCSNAELLAAFTTPPLASSSNCRGDVITVGAHVAVPIALAQSSCSAWLSGGGNCGVLAILREDKVVGLVMSASAVPEHVGQVKQALDHHYGLAELRGEPRSCASAPVPVLTWKSAALTLRYSTLSENCRSGRLVVWLPDFVDASSLF